MTDRLALKASGKIHLGLEGRRKREDGYHEVKMVMQTVSLYDKIVMERTDKPGLYVETNLPYVPNGKENLAYRAAQKLIDEFGIRDGLDIKIRKMIPVAAGMAGGSTDAAAVLVGMNRMFRLGLSKRELMKRGVPLGADVPYCIMRGTALAEGIGEKLTRLSPAPVCHIVLVKPQISVSTKEVYGQLRADALKPEQHPDIDGMCRAIEEQDLDGVIGRLGNVLETVTAISHPEITTIKRLLMEHGAEGALMSGSGPTVFGIYKDREKAAEACRFLKEECGPRLTRQVFLTGFFNNRKLDGQREKCHEK